MTIPARARALQALVLLLAIGEGMLPGRVSAEVSAAAAVPLSAFPRETIAVETHSIRRQLFEAWRADTPAMREQGLMFVPDNGMRADQAMIFVYDPPAQVAMWMKNTILALDMLFVDARGCVVNIKQDARPGSLATIASRYPVALVVELRAGTVASHGFAVGNRVVRIDAGWPSTSVSCAAPVP